MECIGIPVCVKSNWHLAALQCINWKFMVVNLNAEFCGQSRVDQKLGAQMNLYSVKANLEFFNNCTA